MEGLGAEDQKIITLARSARARTGAAEGAAVRDETGRTYAAATVAGLRLTAESLAGRRNRIGTVTVERKARSRPGKSSGHPKRDRSEADQPQPDSGS